MKKNKQMIEMILRRSKIDFNKRILRKKNVFSLINELVSLFFSLFHEGSTDLTTLSYSMNSFNAMLKLSIH